VPTGPNKSGQEQLAKAMQAHRDGRSDVAMAAYRALLQLRRGDATVLANLASALRRTGDQAGALATLEEALHNDPGNAETWFNSSNLLRDGGQPGKAEAAYRKALALRPTLHQAHTNLARILEHLRSVSGAMQEHRKAIAADARNLPALRALGRLARLARLAHSAGAFEESLQCFDAANAVQPGHVDTLLGLGVVLKELGRNDGAMAAANLADALINIGRIRDAERIARGIVERDPNDAQSHLMTGFAQTCQGRVEETMQSILQAHIACPSRRWSSPETCPSHRLGKHRPK